MFERNSTNMKVERCISKLPIDTGILVGYLIGIEGTGTCQFWGIFSLTYAELWVLFLAIYLSPVNDRQSLRPAEVYRLHGRRRCHLEWMQIYPRNIPSLNNALPVLGISKGTCRLANLHELMVALTGKPYIDAETFHALSLLVH